MKPESSRIVCPDCDGAKLVDVPCSCWGRSPQYECGRCGNCGYAAKVCRKCGGQGIIDSTAIKNVEEPDGMD